MPGGAPPLPARVVAVPAAEMVVPPPVAGVGSPAAPPEPAGSLHWASPLCASQAISTSAEKSDETSSVDGVACMAHLGTRGLGTHTLPSQVAYAPQTSEAVSLQPIFSVHRPRWLSRVGS